MLNSHKLRKVQNFVKSETNLRDIENIELTVFHCIENIKCNLDEIDSSFDIYKNNDGNMDEIISRRMAVLMVVDDVIETLSEKFEKDKVKKVKDG